MFYPPIARFVPSNESSHFFQIYFKEFQIYPSLMTRSRNYRKLIIRIEWRKKEKKILIKKERSLHEIKITEIMDWNFSDSSRVFPFWKERGRRRKEESVFARKMEMARSERRKNENKIRKEGFVSGRIEKVNLSAGSREPPTLRDQRADTT